MIRCCLKVKSKYYSWLWKKCIFGALLFEIQCRLQGCVAVCCGQCRAPLLPGLNSSSRASPSVEPNFGCDLEQGHYRGMERKRCLSQLKPALQWRHVHVNDFWYIWKDKDVLEEQNISMCMSLNGKKEDESS